MTTRHPERRPPPGPVPVADSAGSHPDAVTVRLPAARHARQQAYPVPPRYPGPRQPTERARHRSAPSQPAPSRPPPYQPPPYPVVHQHSERPEPPTGGPTGPAAAALLAAGVGCAAFGVIVTVDEASVPVDTVLTLSTSVGSLSGKTLLGVAVYLLAWAVLHGAWRARSVDLARVARGSCLLLIVGLLGTFPPFYALFATH